MSTIPLLSIAVHPATAVDGQNLARGLERLTAEDPTISVRSVNDTGDVVIAGVGELQLEIIVARLRQEFEVEATVDPIRVAYKETVTRAADGEMKYAKQTGGRGQYGHCKIRLYPAEPNSGYLFENAMTRGVIPNEFITPIDDGIREALGRGVLAGYPIADVRVELYDGSYHETDSSTVAFKVAGAMALQDAARKARPALLEPVMHVEVIVPMEMERAVEEDVVRRRGRIESRQPRGGMKIVAARVPLAGMLGYAADLRSLSAGRATFSMSFDRYEVRDGGGDGGAADSIVGVPRRPAPPLRSLGVELPEPDAPDYGG